MNTNGAGQLAGVGTAADTLEAVPPPFAVQLELFDGPLDLLLHLVKVRELPIEKISLAQVASQYLKCLELMEEFDLEIAGEYLVIAATLVSIKSSVLLQQPVEFVTDEDGNLVDPHEELLRRLREAQVYQDSARELGVRSMLDVDVFAPVSSLKQIQKPPAKYRDHDPLLLGEAFRRVLKGAGKEADPMLFTIDSISIVERMMKTLEALKLAGGRIAFTGLLPKQFDCGVLLGTFIALLELCKRQVIGVVQDEDDEIFIMLRSETVTTEGFESEFDSTAEATSA